MGKYSELRGACREFDLMLRKHNPGSGRKYIFEKKPIKVGGDPEDINNKCLLSQEQHIRMVNWWNQVIWEVRNQQ